MNRNYATFEDIANLWVNLTNLMDRVDKLENQNPEPEDKLDKATFKKAMQIFAEEFNDYFTPSRKKVITNNAKYRGSEVSFLRDEQMKSDWGNFVNFIDSRLDDEVLDNMVKDGTLKE